MRRGSVIRFLVMSGLGALTACSEGTPSDTGSGPGTIAGTVTRQKTGLGVPDMVAVLVRDGRVQATAHTDEAGHFSFGRVGAGGYTVRLTGFDIAGLDARFDVVEPQSQSTVVPDGDGALVFTVLAFVAPRINGRVTCDASPAAGARIRVIGGSTDTTVIADAVGRYALLDLEPGRYAVLTEAAPCAVSPAFHSMDLRPGQSGTADFDG